MRDVCPHCDPGIPPGGNESVLKRRLGQRFVQKKRSWYFGVVPSGLLNCALCVFYSQILFKLQQDTNHGLV